MIVSQNKHHLLTVVLLGLSSLAALVLTIACAQPDPEPIPDIAATVRDAVRESMPTQTEQPDIAATARTVAQESLPTQVVVPNAEATARSVVHESLPEIMSTPNVQATVRSVVQELLPTPVGIPNVEATARVIIQSSQSPPPNIPDVEATARVVVAEELSVALRDDLSSTQDGLGLRATMQSMVTLRRYEETGVPISIDEIMVQSTKFQDRGDIPSQFRLQYNNFIGLWLNNDDLESWIQNNAMPASTRGTCCYYLDLEEPALYRAAILDLPVLTRLIDDAERLGLDSRYLAQALDAIQEGYIVVYESFTW